jgi:hypothetical protein
MELYRYKYIISESTEEKSMNHKEYEGGKGKAIPVTGRGGP